MPEFKPLADVVREFLENYDQNAFLIKELRNFELVRFLRDDKNVQKLSQQLADKGETQFEFISNGAKAIALRSESGDVVRLDLSSPDSVAERSASPFMLQAKDTLRETVDTRRGKGILNVEVVPYRESLYSLYRRGAMTEEQAAGIANRLIVEMAEKGVFSGDVVGLGGVPRVDNIGLGPDGVPVIIDPGARIYSYKPGRDETLDMIVDLQHRKESIPPEIMAQDWKWETPKLPPSAGRNASVAGEEKPGVSEGELAGVRGGIAMGLAGATIRGVMAAGQGDGKTAGLAFGKGIVDGLVPDAAEGFSSLHQGNAVDRVLNVGNIATGTAFTVGAGAAVVTGGAAAPAAAGAGAANMGVNLAHDFTYAAGISEQGGPVTSLAGAALTQADLQMGMANVPQPTVDQFLAAMKTQKTTATPDTALNTFFQERDLAGQEAAKGRYMGPKDGWVAVPPETIKLETETAARKYLAQNGSLERAQAALGPNPATQMTQDAVYHVITVAPPYGDGQYKPKTTSDEHLNELASLKAQLLKAVGKEGFAAGQGDPALWTQMKKEAAAYVQQGGDAKSALAAYFGGNIALVDEATLKQINASDIEPVIKQAAHKNDRTAASDSVMKAPLTNAELYNAIQNLNLSYAKIDANHDGNMSLDELRPAFTTPNQFTRSMTETGRG